MDDFCLDITSVITYFLFRTKKDNNNENNFSYKCAGGFI